MYQLIREILTGVKKWWVNNKTAMQGKENTFHLKTTLQVFRKP
jgi:hypothetical protein